ncbi:transglutaminase family protein [Arthrobacter crystallopoietes]|uniref:transglutaminase-like domain-containing protein n=1 Tax=Micrococcaceae TaxID=1268 RepID=UPI0021C6D0F7|nr:transglutaminase family protein [Arthrobacter sp. Marseille-P9274]
MKRAVSARLVAKTAANTSLVFAVAIARPQSFASCDEEFVLTVDGEPVELQEHADDHGGRLHTLQVADPAVVQLDYRATVLGEAAPAAGRPTELIKYVRPSRYCESDKLLPTSYAEFGSRRGTELIRSVREWVAKELSYVSGSSRFTDGAVETLLARRGVCRDYAHLVISLLRAKDVPARLAAVYAPGLQPMDFHAVAEAYVDGTWHMVDATGMAPRASMLRIATGRDTADTAFLSTVGGSLRLQEMRVTAEAEGFPSEEDPSLPFQLG